MRVRLFLIVIVYLSFIVSCKFEGGFKSEQDCDLSDCLTVEPFDAYLTVYFTKERYGFELTNLYLLSGYWEEQNYLDTVIIDTIPYFKDYVELYLPLNHYYTAAAVYVKNDDTVIAIDGTFFQKEIEYRCDSICWRIINNKLNVKLKNTLP